MNYTYYKSPRTNNIYKIGVGETETYVYEKTNHMWLPSLLYISRVRTFPILSEEELMLELL